MKKIAPTFLLVFVALAAWSQDCTQYLFMQQNKTVEMTLYNKKNEPIGKRVTTVSNVNTSGGVTTATLNTQMFDKKGNSTGTSTTTTVKCTGGVFQMDMKLLLPEGPAQRMGTAQVTGGTGILEYPSGMKAGDTLRSASLVISTNNNPPPPASGAPGPPPPPPFGGGSNLTMVVWDRRVDGKESVTTPAGTWDCYKISYKSKLAFKSGPFPPIPHTSDVTEWYAPGVGIIKSEINNNAMVVTSIK